MTRALSPAPWPRLAWAALATFLAGPMATTRPADAGEMTGEERESALRRAQELEDEARRVADVGNFREALPLARESLALREKTLPPEDEAIRDSLRLVGRMSIDSGDFRSAKAALEREVSLAGRALGDDDERTITALQWLGVALIRLGEHDAAKKAFERALAYHERVDGPDDEATGTALNNLAAVLHAMGDFAAARSAYARALEIAERVHGADHPSTAKTANNLGLVLLKLSEFDAARPLLERAVEAAERALPADHPDTLTYRNNLARLLGALGRYEDAEEIFARALAGRVRTNGPEHADTATALVNWAEILCELGRYDEARVAGVRALEIRERVYGPDHAEVGFALSNLAVTLKRLGQIAAARPLAVRGVSILEKALGPSHPESAAARGSLASLLLALGDVATARQMMERTLALQEKSTHVGPDHPDTATTRHNLGCLLWQMGQRAAAEAHVRRSLASREKALGADHPQLAATLAALARMLNDANRSAEARPMIARSLSIRERMLGAAHPLTAHARVCWARTCARTGDAEEARRSYRRALADDEAYLRRELPGATGAERMALLRSVRNDLDAWLRDAPSLGTTGYAEVLGFKGIVSRFEAMERRLAREGGEAWRERVEELRGVERRLAALANAVPAASAVERATRWRAQYADLTARREELSSNLSKEFASYREALESQGAGLAEIRASLPPKSALVDYLWNVDRYVAWVVLPDAEPVRVELGGDEAIDNAARVFVTACRAKATTLASKAYLQAGKALGDRVVAPVAARLPADVATVYLCADEALSSVPFAALPGRAPGKAWLDELRIVHLTMAQDLVSDVGRKPAGRGALLVGGVDYDAGDPSAGGAPPTTPAPGSVLALRSRAPVGGRFDALAATGREVEALRARLGETDAHVLSGVEATESSLRALAPGRRLLHLATHGFVRDDLMAGLRRADDALDRLPGAGERHLAGGHDPMLLCGLAFAGANVRDGGDGDDGILTAAEVSSLDLSACDVVVLSACDTARGTPESGEGVQGLVRALRLAGAASVVGSLWRIDDEATRLLMGRFYEGLLRKEEPRAPADALREAVTWLRDSKPEGKDFSAPRFWAAFVAYGR